MTSATDREPHSLEAMATSICAAFGLPSGRASRIAPVARGAVGRVWRLDVGTEPYAVKEFFWGAEEHAARREVAFRDRAATLGVRSPVPFPAGDGTYVALLPPAPGGAAIRLYSWLEGRAVAPADPSVHPAVGTLLAALHRIGTPTAGAPDPWYEVLPSEPAWRVLVADAAAARRAWHADLAAALPAVLALASLVTPTDPADRMMCHLDLQASNLLHDGEGLILLDWDNAGPGSPRRELGSLVVDWGAPGGRPDPVIIRALVAAYRLAGGTATLDAPDAFDMHLATRLHFLYVQAELALDATASEEHRTRADAWTRDVLANLPRLAVFDEIRRIALRT